jgi:glutathione S-transferase
MKLYYSPTSPFVRKVMVCALELGLADRLEKETTNVGPIDRNQSVIPVNPLAQVPSAVTDDGLAIHDSRVICEYLDSLAGGNRLFPAPGNARWRALTEQSTADGLLDAALLGRYERARPAEKQYEAWHAGQMDKIRTALNQCNAWVPMLGARVDIGTIAIGCALGYLDFRYDALGWRTGRQPLADWYAGFAARASMQQTRPPG